MLIFIHKTLLERPPQSERSPHGAVDREGSLICEGTTIGCESARHQSTSRLEIVSRIWFHEVFCGFWCFGSCGMYSSPNGPVYREARSIFSATKKFTNWERLRDSAFFPNNPSNPPNG
jgi:hypothetical protein